MLPLLSQKPHLCARALQFALELRNRLFEARILAGEKGRLDLGRARDKVQVLHKLECVRILSTHIGRKSKNTTTKM
jgi:hypothetical protein